MNKKKIISFLGMVLIVAVVFWVTNMGKNRKTSEEKSITMQRPNPQISLETANKITWNMEEGNWPSKAKAYKATKNNYASALNYLLEYTGLLDKDKSSDSPQITVYNDVMTNKSLFVNKTSGIIGYSQDISNKSQINKTKQMDIKEIEAKLNEIISKLTNDEKVTISITQRNYEKIDYPRLIDISSSLADLIELKADYVIEGVEVRTFYQEPITARFSIDGKLVKLDYVPLSTITDNQEVAIKDINELKNTKTNDFKIWDKKGGASFELSEDKALGDSITITQAKLVEIQSDKGDVIWPYFLLEGNSISSNGPVKVYLITAANK